MPCRRTMQNNEPEKFPRVRSNVPIKYTCNTTSKMAGGPKPRGETFNIAL